MGYEFAPKWRATSDGAMKLLGRLEFGSGAVTMRYEPRRQPSGRVDRQVTTAPSMGGFALLVNNTAARMPLTAQELERVRPAS